LAIPLTPTGVTALNATGAATLAAAVSAELAAGNHVLVFELNKRDLPTALTLRSDDVSFANE
jgi:hypothetical protein